MEGTSVKSLGKIRGGELVCDVGAPQGPPSAQVGGPSPQLLCMLAASGLQLLPA